MNFEENIVVSENPDGVLTHASQAREFLNKARGYLAAGDLHPASEKGWGAAARMARAVALAQGWPHERHSRFHQVMNQSGQRTGSDRVRLPHGRAPVLRINFHELSGGLDAEVIGEDLGNMAELLDVLEPLTNGASG